MNNPENILNSHQYYPSKNTDNLYYLEIINNKWWNLYKREFLESGTEAHPLNMLEGTILASPSVEWLYFMVDSLNEKVFRDKIFKIHDKILSGSKPASNEVENVIDKFFREGFDKKNEI